MLSRNEVRLASSTVLQSPRTGQIDYIALRLPTSCRGQSIRPFQTDSGTIVVQEGGGGERENEKASWGVNLTDICVSLQCD